MFNQRGKNIDLYNTPPSDDANSLLFEYFVSQIVGIEPPIAEYISDITLRVIKLINLHKTINKHKTEINNHTVDVDDFAQELLDCVTITDVQDVGVNALDNLDKRTAYRLDPKTILDIVPVNIPDISQCIDEGGVPAGTLSFWLGATGVGKTTALITTAKIALVANKKVLYVSAELSLEQILKRFDSAMTGIPINEIRHKAEAVRDALRASPRYQMAMKNLVVHEVPMGAATVKDLEALVKYYQTKKQWHPDLLVVDYADNLAPLKANINAPRLEIFSIYRDLRALGQKYKFAVWTASQLNDAGTGASEEENGVISVRHANEARGKTHLADLIIGIGRSVKDLQQGMARLQLVKNRFGINDGRVVPIITHYACSLLWTNEQVPSSQAPAGPSTLDAIAAAATPVTNTEQPPTITTDANIDRFVKKFEMAEHVLEPSDL